MYLRNNPGILLLYKWNYPSVNLFCILRLSDYTNELVFSCLNNLAIIRQKFIVFIILKSTPLRIWLAWYPSGKAQCMYIAWENWSIHVGVSTSAIRLSANEWFGRRAGWRTTPTQTGTWGRGISDAMKPDDIGCKIYIWKMGRGISRGYFFMSPFRFCAIRRLFGANFIGAFVVKSVFWTPCIPLSMAISKNASHEIRSIFSLPQMEYKHMYQLRWL